MKNKRVFVTGACGFIGSNLVKKLLFLGAEVIALKYDKHFPYNELGVPRTPKLQMVCGDVRHKDKMERIIQKYEPNYVFHLAAQPLVGIGYKNPHYTLDVDVAGTYSVLEACRLGNGDQLEGIVVASSDKAYGESLELPYKETMPLDGKYPYEMAKSCADIISHGYAFSYDLPIVITRCGNVFGHGDFHWSRLIPGAIQAAFSQEHFTLRSHSRCSRDYIYIDDVVDMYIYLAREAYRRRGIAYNISYGSEQNNFLVVQKIYERFGLSSKLIHSYDKVEDSTEIEHQWLDNSRVKNHFGIDLSFLGTQSLFNEKLDKTIGWYKNYFERIKNE